MTRIIPISAAHHEQVSDILFEAFHSKFKRLTSLDGEQLRDFVQKLAPVECNEGTWVAEADGQIVGVISLKWKNMKKGRPANPIQLRSVVNEYGLINVIRFLVGMALLQESLSAEECYIEYIAVSPSARGTGVGHQLLEFGEKLASEQQLSRYTLYVAISNPRARDLYQRVGFGVTNKVTSLLTKLFVNERGFYYMVKPLAEKAVGVRTWRLKKHWGLGIFGFIGFFALPGVWMWLQGEGSASHLLGLLWFLFFDYFIPERK